MADTSRAAPQLRLAVTAEFKNRPDGLPGLQRFRRNVFEQFDLDAYDLVISSSHCAAKAVRNSFRTASMGSGVANCMAVVSGRHGHFASAFFR